MYRSMNTCKNALIDSNAKNNDCQHILIDVEQSLIYIWPFHKLERVHDRHLLGIEFLYLLVFVAFLEPKI